MFCVFCVGTGPPETPRTHLAHKESQAAPAFGSPALPAGRQAGNVEMYIYYSVNLDPPHLLYFIQSSWNGLTRVLRKWLYLWLYLAGHPLPMESGRFFLLTLDRDRTCKRWWFISLRLGFAFARSGFWMAVHFAGNGFTSH